jgi:drug/metabolite transporter (DMT)-like permease
MTSFAHIEPGLLYLAASVSCSVIVSVLLKFMRSSGVDLRQAIFSNYIVATALCWLIFVPSPMQALQRIHAWPLMLTLAVLLPTVFIAMGQSVRHAGIVRSDVAQRLSLFIPLLAAFALFGEPLTQRKGLAILAAFAALACLLNKPGAAAKGEGSGGQSWMWPLAVWVGYGVIDILFKRLAQTGTAFTSGLLGIFVLAAVLMLLYLLVSRAQWQWRTLAMGLALGAVNFGNIYTYIKAHQSLPGNPALVFAAMNMGVVSLGTLVGALAFREPLSRVNILGLILALAAIAAMMPS